MKISRTGGIIAAASRKIARPMLQVGSISIVRREVITLQQCGVFPIIIITGSDEYDVRYELADYGVIFVPGGDEENPRLLECAQIGMKYLQGKCDRVVFTPVNIPMFTADTLQKLIQAPGDMVSPRYQGHFGHPFVLSAAGTRYVLEAPETVTLRDALQPLAEHRTVVEVEDPGIFANIHNEADLRERLEEHNQAILRPRLRVTFEREAPFFSSRLKLLLFLIADTSNLRQACKAMALSPGKAWEMINGLERELGYPVVERTQGGRHGGNTRLTEKGEAFLLASQEFEENVYRFAQDRFQELFLRSGMIR